MPIAENPAFQGYSFETQYEEDGAMVMCLKNSTGEGEMRCYPVFPGITFSYNTLRMTSCYQQVAPVAGYISLNYCRSGSFEVVLDNGKSYFMTSGDMVISDPGNAVIVDSRVPRGFYEGVSIMIERSQAQQWIEEHVPWVESLATFFGALDNRSHTVSLLVNKRELMHQNEGLYAEFARKSQAFRITTVLAILQLMAANMGDLKPIDYYPPAVISATMEAQRYLAHNPTQILTIDKLCEKHHIARSNFQRCFKSIYGQTPAQYMRSIRMQYAAKLLRTNDEKSISEIAAMLGYSNASKFSAAFRSVMNNCPLEYRRQQCGDCCGRWHAKME